MTVTIYHNPRCSKSRQTLELINQSGISPKIIEYLKADLSHSKIKTVLTLLNADVREIMRTSDSAYKEQKLDDPALTEENLIEAIIETPALLQRPIVVKDNKAVIGRPPEKVLEIL